MRGESYMEKSITSPNGMKDVNLFDYLYIIFFWRRIILWLVGGATVVTASLLFLVIPRYYKSTTLVMPPKQKGQFSVSSVLKNIVPFGGFGLGKASDEMYNYIAILESRTCQEEIARKFDLVNRYGVNSMEKALKELRGNVNFTLGQDDVVLEVEAWDTDREVAADMANSFVSVLNQQYLKLMTMEAKGNREFLERRLEQNQKDLASAEENLREYQRKNGIYSVPEQVKAAISAAATLQSMKLAKEVEYGILSKTIDDRDPKIKAIRVEVSELTKKLQQMNYGVDSLSARSEIFASFQQTPELAMQYLRRFREVEIQQKLLEVLFPLVEQARIEEHRDTPTILVLDPAVPADRPTKPKRIVILLAVFVSSLVISIFAAFVADFLTRMRDEFRNAGNDKAKYVMSNMHWRIFFDVGKSPKRKSVV